MNHRIVLVSRQSGVVGGYGEQARNAASKAMGAQTKSETAHGKVTNIVDRLPDDQKKADQIQGDIKEANKNIRSVQEQVNEVRKLVPDAVQLLNKLDTQAERLKRFRESLTSNITHLRDLVQLARNQANLVSVFLIRSLHEFYFCFCQSFFFSLPFIFSLFASLPILAIFLILLSQYHSSSIFFQLGLSIILFMFDHLFFRWLV